MSPDFVAGVNFALSVLEDEADRLEAEFDGNMNGKIEDQHAHLLEAIEMISRKARHAVATN
jgi:hypothetical protein